MNVGSLMNHEQAAQERADRIGAPIIGVQWPDGSLLPVGLPYGRWLLAQTPNLTEAFVCYPAGQTPPIQSDSSDIQIDWDNLA